MFDLPRTMIPVPDSMDFRQESAENSGNGRKVEAVIR
jgi:hypothetical protein